MPTKLPVKPTAFGTVMLKKKVARLLPAHARFLGAYRAQRWDEAEAAIVQCRSVGIERLDAYYALFMARVGALRSAGLPSDWNGAYALTEK